MIKMEANQKPNTKVVSRTFKGALKVAVEYLKKSHVSRVRTKLGRTTNFQSCATKTSVTATLKRERTWPAELSEL